MAASRALAASRPAPRRTGSQLALSASAQASSSTLSRRLHYRAFAGTGVELASLRRRQASLFQAVRSLHQTTQLLQAQGGKQPRSSSGQPAPAPAKSSPSTPPAPSDPTQPAASTGSSSDQPKTLQQRAKELWATAKYLFKFYFNGVKQIWANRNRVAEIQQRVAAGGESLTREEAQLIRIHRADMRKLPLFLTILLILEEALPLVVIWAPSLLPSTCILPNQLLKIRMKEEVTRAAAFKELKEAQEVQALLPVVEGSGPDARLGEAHRAQEGEDVLKQLKGETLVLLAKLFSLSTWGGTAMVRRRLTEHLKYIRSDDEMMCEGNGLAHIPQNADALARACSERGLRATDVPHKEMFETLRTWLRYTTRNAETRGLPTASASLLPLQLYNAASLQEIEASLEAESARGLIEKTKDVLNEVVQEEKKVLERDQRSEHEVQAKQKSEHEAQAKQKSE